VVVAVETLAPDERPDLRGQSRFAWASLIDDQVHPVKVAVVEVLRLVGGPLSARDLWLIGVGEPAYSTVCYHVKALADLGLIEQTHRRPARGSVEKFYVIRAG
jgi:hypothetical protein